MEKTNQIFDLYKTSKKQENIEIKNKMFFYVISGILEKSFVKFVKKIIESDLDNTENNTLIYCLSQDIALNINTILWSYEVFLPHLIYENVFKKIDKKTEKNTDQKRNIISEIFTNNINDFYQTMIEEQKILLSEDFVYAHNPKILCIMLNDKVNDHFECIKNKNDEYRDEDKILKEFCQKIIFHSKNFQKIYVFTHKKYMINYINNPITHNSDNSNKYIVQIIDYLWNNFHFGEKVFWEQKD